MDLNALKALDSHDLGRLIEAMQDQRHAVSTGSIVGYGQSREDEIDEINALIAKLQAVL